MIIVDSNVIIDYWKCPDETHTNIFANEDVRICGVVAAELLHGARSDKDFQKLYKAVNALSRPSIDIPDWIEIGKMLYQLRIKGITVPFQDVVIAHLTIANDAEIWTNDKHFNHISQVYPELKPFVLL